MTSSRSCSGSATLALAAVLAAAALAGCRHAAAPGGSVVPDPKASRVLALFPVQNASGGSAPVRALTEALEAALVAKGVRVVPRRELDEVLARHRLRYTGGVDRATAQALRSDLQVEGVIVPTLEEHSTRGAPRVAIAVRVTDVADRPVVLWADAVARAGEDAPGLLRLGVVESMPELERTVVDAVASAVARFVAGRTAPDACSAGRFEPRRWFRAPVLDDVGRRAIAVLPFRNESGRRGAGEVLVGQFIARLSRSGAFEVLDPGAVREQMLAHRIVLEGGVSIDRAMALLDVLEAELVVSGDVHELHAGSGPRDPATAEFTAYVLDRDTAEQVWSSTSKATGEDGVFFFGAGRVETTSALSCRMVSGVVDRIVGARGQLPPLDDAEAQLQPLRTRPPLAHFQRRGREASYRNFYGNGREGRARGMNHGDRLPAPAPAQDAQP